MTYGLNRRHPLPTVSDESALSGLKMATYFSLSTQSRKKIVPSSTGKRLILPQGPTLRTPTRGLISRLHHPDNSYPALKNTNFTSV